MPISDSFELPLAGGRADLRNPDNWFTIPFKEDFDSIDYLFKLAHKQLEIEMCHKRIKEIKLNLKNKIGYKYSNIKLKTNVQEYFKYVHVSCSNYTSVK